MKEKMKSKSCFFILVVVAILSFIAGVVVIGHAVFLLGNADVVVGFCHVVMAITLMILVVFLIKGKY